MSLGKDNLSGSLAMSVHLEDFVEEILVEFLQCLETPAVGTPRLRRVQEGWITTDQGFLNHSIEARWLYGILGCCEIMKDALLV